MQDGIIKKTCEPGYQLYPNSMQIQFDSKQNYSIPIWDKKIEFESDKNNPNPSRIRRKIRQKFDLISQFDPTNILNI